MGTLEIIIISGFALFVLYTLYSVFFSNKKKKEKTKKIKKEKEPKEKKSKKPKKDKNEKFKLFKRINKKEKEEKFDGEKKVERVINPDKPIEPVKEEQKEPELTLQKEPPKDKSFKIIRKKSEVKINKKAIKADSRNPSITKVFDKGKRVDGGEEIEEKKDDDLLHINDLDIFGDDFETFMINEDVEEEPKTQGIVRYRFNEPKFKEHLTDNMEGKLPVRAPRIKDRTNFGNHLHVSHDNNLSGVAGIGINKAIKQAESQAVNSVQATEDMVEDVFEDVFDERNQSLDSVMAMMRGVSVPEQNRPPQTPKEKLKSIDAETLIMADALINPKYKKNKK